MKKWLYPLLIAFVAFLIFSSPTSAGSQTRTFVIWLGDMAEAAGDFLDGLFTDEAEADTPELLQPNQDDITVEPQGGTVAADPEPAPPPPTIDIEPEPDPGTGDSSDDFGSPPTG